MLLCNEQIVKRTKATPLPMTDEVIAHLTSLSDNRKSSKTVYVRQPVFEQNNRVLYDDDDIDDADDFGDHVEPMMIHSYELPYDDEHVANEIQSELDVPDELRDEIPGHYESNSIVDQLLEEIDSDAVNDSTGYDDTPPNDQALLDDIFGIDSDDNFDIVTNVVDATNEPTIEVEPVAEPVLRRSARNHKPGRLEKRYVGHSTYQWDVLSRKYIFNMTISESISKYGNTAVDSIDQEMRQIVDLAGELGKGTGEGVTNE
jgi:hypothetical protein